MKKAKPSVLHPRNKHQGRYDLADLCRQNPALSDYVQVAPKGGQTVNFANSQAVVELNKALLIKFYGVTFWQLPQGFLCPPIPGRADYIHYLADLLIDWGVPRKTFNQVKVLDVGTGANLVYPIIGSAEYGWQFTASDIDAKALKNAKAISRRNDLLAKLSLRKQPDNKHIFKNIIQSNEYYHLTLCNPPFHESAAAALAGTQRKNKNLHGSKGSAKDSLNFGGQANELWCIGGERAFVLNMIRESRQFAEQVGWFSCLISKKENLYPLTKALKKLPIKDLKTVNMAQGQKVSRFLAWTFNEKRTQGTLRLSN